MTGNLQRRLAPYFFISPFFIGYAIFFGYPVLSSLYLSFFKQTGISSERTFVGIENYVNLLSDELFLKSLGNTTYYALGSIFVIVPAALGLALILTIRNLRLREFFRLFFFTPYVMSGVVIAIIFTLVFEGQYGLVNNYLLAPLGLPKVDWLRNPATIMPAIILLGLWRFVGINALYFMVGLQNVPEELKEAARIDGANRFQVFRHVTLPLLRPIMIFVISFAVIGSYTLFAEPAVLVGVEGGPENAGLFMTMYLYLAGFRELNFGYASAIGYAIALIIIVVNVLQLRILGVFRED
jgi:arabinosaccharide transport system permease protein